MKVALYIGCLMFFEPGPIFDNPLRDLLRTYGMTRLSTALFALPLAGCSVIGVHGDIEQPPYEIVEYLSDDIEIRRYNERFAVEATVTADDPNNTQNAAFRLLFDYISGANLADAEIAMTVPVEMTDGSKEIEMTAPVETQVDETGSTTMRFFLPARFTAETTPQPTDNRVRIVTMPKQSFAVLRFSGSRNEQAVSAKEEELRSTLATFGLNTGAGARAFFYDPPWTLPWFRRNEVAIEVTLAGDD